MPRNVQDQIAPETNNVVQWIWSAAYDRNKPVLIDAANPSRIVTLSIAESLSRRLSGAFNANSTVCLHLPNDVLYPVLMLGIWASHCRWTGCNTAYTQYELRHHLLTSKARYIVTLAEQLDVVELATSDLEDVEIIMFSDILQQGRPFQTQSSGSCSPHETRKTKANLFEKVEDYRTLHDLLRAEPTESDTRYLDVKGYDIASLQTTSGTSGQPKMAERSHKALMLESAAIEEGNSAKDYEVRRLFCTPIFHAFSTPVMAINSLRFGHTTYIMNRFDDDCFPQKVQDFQITETAAPPPILMRLYEKALSWHLLQSLRLIYCGGAPLVDGLRTRALSMFAKPPRIVQVWGMTEGGWFSTFSHPEVDGTNSVGRLLQGLEIKIDMDSAVDTSEGKVAGELLVRGKQLMRGYCSNAQATKDAFSEEWLRTGDVGYVEGGKIYLVDRLKDLIKVNGWQVAPTEIENALLQLPSVVDAAAISAGQGHEEFPMVFVVCADHLQEDLSPTTGSKAGQAIADVKRRSNIKRHLNERLARYKVRAIEIHFVDSIPRNPSGKILRRQLKESAAR